MKLNREIWKIAFAYTGVIVGAGFSTGQEILQFFTNHGLYSYIAILLSGLIVLFIGRQATKFGYRIQAESHKTPIFTMFGKISGTIIDYLFVFFLYGIAVIMFAGAGSAFNESFGVPYWLGTLIMVFFVVITLMLDFDKIVAALGAVTPFLIAVVVIIALFNIFNPQVPLEEVNALAQPERTPSGLWFLDGAMYAGFTLATAFSFLSIMGANSSSHTAAARGGLLGGVIITILMILINAALISNMDTVNEIALPTLSLADNIHPALQLILAVVMLLVIYNTAVGVMYPFLKRYSIPYSKKYYIILIIAAVIGYFLSFVGFVELVGIVYPAFGILGLLIGLGLTIRWFMNKSSRKELL
ncbi:YkvI family membrane protein [Salinicoccus kekensis]|uniref:Uncharacterized membrane protein YkvI n=1 Tax=Salinicoccus kekensis TaxID=714307 RepID=A0A285USF8_9STAP|nr:hypothetical protein [Salinicoccus kekensis]SOC44752.1 uncharacterized membrane protein YkvI [Salinicoccus kekensis]